MSFFDLVNVIDVVSMATIVVVAFLLSISWRADQDRCDMATVIRAMTAHAWRSMTQLTSWWAYCIRARLVEFKMGRLRDLE
jgi:hypothetical protein